METGTVSPCDTSRPRPTHWSQTPCRRPLAGAHELWQSRQWQQWTNIGAEVSR